MNDKKITMLILILIFSGITLLLSSIKFLLMFIEIKTSKTIIHLLGFLYMSLLGFILIMFSLEILLIKYIIHLRIKNIILENMNDDERKIVYILSRNGGKIFQSELVDKTGFSPSKVSRIIKNLEKLGIIVCKKNGRLKVVSLSDYISFNNFTEMFMKMKCS